MPAVFVALKQSPVVAQSSRDFWDVLLIVVALVGAIAAITAFPTFIAWALDRRRRPEALILWQFITYEATTTLREWPPAEIPKLARGAPLYVRVAMRNIGDAYADSVLTNFVVPDCLTLEVRNNNEAKLLESTNTIAGLVTDGHRVRYFAKADSIAAGDWLVRDYEIRQADHAQPRRVRLLFDLSCARFNATGNRRFPSLAIRLEVEAKQAPVGTEWPPPRARRQLRRVRTAPFERVLCHAGGRKDVREVELV